MSGAAKIPTTPAGVDQAIVKMEILFKKVQASKDSIVKLPKAELELLQHFEAMSECITETMQKHSDRSVLDELFGGDCTRVARIEAVLSAVEFSDMNKADQRKARLERGCKSVDGVLIDKGLGAKLKAAQIIEEKALLHKMASGEIHLDLGDVALEGDQEELAESKHDEVIAAESEGAEKGKAETDTTYSGLGVGLQESVDNQLFQHLAAAAALESTAVEADRAGAHDKALAAYHDCEQQLAAAAAMLTDLSERAQDHRKLVKHREEVLERIKYLEGLGKDDVPDEKIPVESQIGEIELDAFELADKDDDENAGGLTPLQMAQKAQRQKRKAVLATCGAVGAGAGLVCLGPIGLGAASLTATVVGAGAATGFIATNDGKLGETTYTTGEKLYKPFEQGMQKLEEKADSSGATAMLGQAKNFGKQKTAEIGEKLGIDIRQSLKDVKREVKRTTAAVNDKLDEKLGTNTGKVD